MLFATTTSMLPATTTSMLFASLNCDCVGDYPQIVTLRNPLRLQPREQNAELRYTGACTCDGGWVGRDCAVFAIGSSVRGECSEVGKNATLTLRLKSETVGKVTCTLRSADVNEVMVPPSVEVSRVYGHVCGHVRRRVYRYACRH